MSRYEPARRFDSFMDSLRAKAPQDQFNAASEFISGNSSIDTFFEFLNELPAELKSPIALAHAARYVDKIQSRYDLLRLIHALPIASRAAFAEREDCLAKIKDARGMGEVLDLLPASGRMTFAINVRAYISSPKYDLMRYIEDDDLINKFINSCLNAIKDGNDLAHVLEWIDSSSRDTWVELHLAKIKDGMELHKVLMILPANKRVDIATRCLDKVQNSEQLFLMIDACRYYNENHGQEQALMVSPDYLAKFEECFRKIETINDVYNLLECLIPASRGAFAERAECLAQIHTADQFERVLRLLPDGSVLGVAEACATKIDSMQFLLYVLERLPADSRLNFLRKPFLYAKIENGHYLANVFEILPRESRYALALNLRSKIQNGYQLRRVLLGLFVSTASRSEVFSFAELCRDQIKTEKEIAIIFLIKEFQDLAIEEKISFIDGCNPSLRVNFLLAIKAYARTLFDDPLIRQKFSLAELDPNIFLFSAAADPLGEADFEYFLQHPLCAPDGFNESAKTLVMHIEEQEGLSGEIKASRIAKVIAQQEVKRKETAAQYLGINLSTLKQTELKFEGALPAIEAVIWPETDLDPARIRRFQQLIRWLNVEPSLVAYQAGFTMLENNAAIRVNAQTFNSIVDDLESFVATLALYLSQRKAPANETDRLAQARGLASHLDACDQLGECVAGVRSSLQSMMRSLNPGAGLSNAVSHAVDQATKVFIDLSGIEAGMEVHAWRDWLVLQLGVSSRLHHDPYRLPIAMENLRAIARSAAERLTPAFLIEQSLPQLESMQAEQDLTFNKDLIIVLERDWQLLYSSGLLTEKRTTSTDKCVDVMRFIDSTLNEEAARVVIAKYTEENNTTQVLGRNLSIETLTRSYREFLEHSGILSIGIADITNIEAGIWAILTANESDLSRYDPVFKRILNAPNALAWVKAVIESHTTDERTNIKLHNLLHCPNGSSQSLFRALAVDPYSAGWLMGWELKRTGAKLSFDPSDTHFLGRVIGDLVADTPLMHKELEEIFVRPGNLLFSLGELRKDATRLSTFECILDFISAKDMCRFDSFLGVLDEMTKKGDATEKTTAQSFLAARCDEQKAQNLWSCYWKTACYLENAELKFDSREMLQSLKDPANARAALYIAKTNQALVLKIMEAVATMPALREDCASILETVRGLFPAESLGGAGASAGAEESASAGAGASARVSR